MTVKQLTRRSAERLRGQDSAVTVEYALRFTMGFLLSRARIFTDFAPFGVAFAAAAPQGGAGLVTVAGAVLGTLSGGFVWGVKYIAAIVIIRSVLRLFGDIVTGSPLLFPPLTALGAMLLIGGVYAFDGGWAVRSTAMYILETVLAGGCTLFYTVALSPWTDGSSGTFGRSCHYVSATLLIATLLISLCGANLFGVLSVGRWAAVVLVMTVTYRGGAGTGCVFAAAMGAAMDLASGAPPFFTMCYVISSMLSGIFSRDTRAVFTVAYVISSAIGVVWLWAWGATRSALYETFAASVVFMLLPETVLAKAGGALPFRGGGYGFMKAREYARDRVELTADAFQEMYNAVKNASCDESEDVSGIFDRASEKVCRDCSSCSRCWIQDYVDTVDVMNNLTPLLLRNGSVTEEDFPRHFASRCSRARELAAAISCETRAFICRRQCRARLGESRGAAYSQYRDVAAVLRNLSRDLGGEITVEPALERRLQRYLRGLGLSATAAVFHVRGGRLRVELRCSDMRKLTGDGEYLNRLSSLLGTRLCTSDERVDGDRLVLLEAEPLSVTIGVAGKRRDGETVSGDRGVFFRTDEGFLYVLLSDGMGSGEGAAKLSSSATSTLERFLRAGVAPEIALRLLSDLMLLRNDTEVVSATVDMLCLNMFSGEARIYKCGAAPSYFKRGGSVKRMRCGSLPVGFSGGVSGHGVSASVRMSPGTFAVLVSDGVTGGDDDRWLRKTVAEFADGGDPKELAGNILSGASSRADGGDDDMTALVVRTQARQ